MRCENCKKTQQCNKSHSWICDEFELYGIKPQKPKKSKALCSGCMNDYYNSKYHDKNPFGGKGCMSYKTAKVVLKSYPNSLNDRPPWRVEWQLDCFYRRW